MADNALVQTRIDPVIKERAAEVLQDMGLSISDAVRILLTRTAREGALPFELQSSSTAHDAWFREQVEAALRDPTPPLEDAEVRDYFDRKRLAALAKAGSDRP